MPRVTPRVPPGMYRTGLNRLLHGLMADTVNGALATPPDPGQRGHRVQALQTASADLVIAVSDVLADQYRA